MHFLQISREAYGADYRGRFGGTGDRNFTHLYGSSLDHAQREVS